MSFIEQLKKDHAEVKKNLTTLTEQEADEIDKKLVEETCDALLFHMELEEKYLYPRMEKIKETEEMAEEAELEHKEAKTVINELKKGTLRSTKLKVKLEILLLEISHHVEEEEEEVFPTLKKAMSAAMQQTITDEMNALRAKKEKVPQKA